MNPTHYTYTIKCRNCGVKTICGPYYTSGTIPNRFDFELFIQAKELKPSHSRCNCDPSSMMLHDLVSYSL